MKKAILFLLITFGFTSCTNSNVKDIATFQFNNAWYWVIQYEEGTTQQEVEDYVNKMANPNQTSYFYAYDKSLDVSVFAKEKFNLQSFASSILDDPKPNYGFYKIPSDTKIYDDGIDVLKYAIGNK